MSGILHAPDPAHSIVSGRPCPETTQVPPLSAARLTFQNELKAHLPILRRVALGLTRNAAAADDLTQDCAERALRKHRLYQADKSGMRPWLITMLINLHRNQIRAAQSRPQSAGGDPEILQTAAPDVLHARLDLADTARAIEHLPEDQREALLTVVLSGMSYKEAAECLALPIGTLMSRLGRARAALRKTLKEEAR